MGQPLEIGGSKSLVGLAEEVIRLAPGVTAKRVATSLERH
jgi:hypothetical protein